MSYVIRYTNHEIPKTGFYDGFSDVPADNLKDAFKYETVREAWAVARFDLYCFKSKVLPLAEYSREFDDIKKIVLKISIAVLLFLCGVIFTLFIITPAAFEKMAC